MPDPFSFETPRKVSSFDATENFAQAIGEHLERALKKRLVGSSPVSAGGRGSAWRLADSGKVDPLAT